ncbi:hypothetical protein HALLA_09140 [Halostagnicola larsenii XH-48]|uniref:Uncharacterized protein n=1 Tax=Halostagnicola larsenii XH-48 TaxID=797299 RepID=W0JQF4_9EURY|nr:hypothetical protein HALLA_09140 [Halostagnicola larsenii XH-48]
MDGQQPETSYYTDLSVVDERRCVVIRRDNESGSFNFRPKTERPRKTGPVR